MADRYREQTNRRVHRAAAVGTAVGALLTFGVGPLAATPAAHADGELDWPSDLLEPAVSAFATADVTAPAVTAPGTGVGSWLDPTAGDRA